MTKTMNGHGINFFIMNLNTYNYMKTNKRRFGNLFIVASFVSLLLVGCKQEDVAILQFNMPHFQNSGKVYIDETIPRWMEGDIINVNNVACTLQVQDNDNLHSYAVAVVTRSNNYKAIFPNTFIVSETDGFVSMSLPEVQSYRMDPQTGVQIVEAPMCAQSNTTDLQFKNMGGLLAIDIKNTRSNSMVVDFVSIESANESVALWGPAEAHDFASETPYFECTGTAADYNRVYLRDDDGWDMFTLAMNEHKVVYIYVPSMPNTALNKFSVTVYTHEGRNAYNYTKSQQTLGAGNVRYNELVDVNFTMGPNDTRDLDVDRTAELLDEIEGAVPNAVFSVSRDNQVYFSKGNLQYNPSNDVWQFAEHQWDFVGDANRGNVYVDRVKCDNSQIEEHYTGWLDLFGWGTSGYNNTANDQYAINYLPYSNSTATVNSTYNTYGYGPSKNMAPYNLTGANALYDWGVRNPIRNGGGEAGMWRTLSYAEWKYLLTQRTVNGGTGENNAYSIVTVQNVRGILIYPDGYTEQVSSGTELSTVPDGCAFLPSAGYRTGRTMYYAGSYFSYWSTNNNIPLSSGTMSPTANQAVAVLNGSGSTLTINSRQDRCRGNSVRLVRDVE